MSSLNTFLATHLVARLRNEHLHPDNPNRILGTVVNGRQDYPIPEGVRKVIDVPITLSSLKKSNSSKKSYSIQMLLCMISTSAILNKLSLSFPLSRYIHLLRKKF